MSLLSAPVVDSAWLQEHLGDVIIADVRWGMAEGAKRQDYLAEHLPGAVFVDLDVDMSAPPGATGRHPLPDPASFAAAMGRLGIGDSSTVVAYDDAAGVMAAARLWYTLDSVGVSASVLDGGIQGWNGPLESGEAVISPEQFRVREWPVDRFVDAAFVSHNLDTLNLLDARSAERFEGVEGGIDARPGHIPGARSSAWTENLDDRGRFKPAGLSRDFAMVDDESPVVYCGSGVSACHTLLALRLGGVAGRLYTGSMSEWAQDPDRPVEQG